MSEIVTVNFTSTALSFLLFENVKSNCDQEGFLLGETNVIVTKTITDSDSQSVKLRKVININSVVPCPTTCAFYNGGGDINSKEIENILGDEISSVVAWYKFEPELKFELSIRDKIIHKELSTSGLFAIPTELFSLCLLTTNVLNLGSTHSFAHKFLRFYEGQFVNVPLHIANLGELSNYYKPKVQSSKYFTDICKSVGLPKRGGPDLKYVEKIQDKLQTEMVKVMTNLSTSELRKQELESEFEQLMKKKEYYELQMAERQMKQALLESERKKREEIEKAEKEILDLINFDFKMSEPKRNLKNDLGKKIDIKKVKNNLSENLSINNDALIDLTSDEEDNSEDLNTPVKNSKVSYANMAKKK